ncbi:MAG: helix-turn-helix transcriptional regulator [Planctomycetes bacterium]|nr:helix-turn-helix transcriptional regulator [Planctomycetota bacterium]MCW8138449.1 helix-turn-helix transcriptional regulator [Planctomycetota bacterium]
MWKLLTPEKLKAFRAEHKVSRARLAQMIGVSTTSIQNWESGTVASLKVQHRLAELIAAGPAAILAPRKAPSLWDVAGGASPRADSAISATGEIVASYLKSRKELPAKELVEVIRAVRAALA